METLPFDLWKTIFGFVPDHLFAARCTCQAWHTLCEAEHAKISPRTILETLEVGGDPSWLKAAVTDWKPEQANALLDNAVAAGNLEGVELAKTWGAYYFDKAFYDATENGCVGAMELLRPWMAGSPDLNDCLSLAAEKGHLAEMELLKSWGATDFGWALCSAAEHGRLEAMEWARQWLTLEAVDFIAVSPVNQALTAAATGDHVEAMRLLYTWGARELTSAVREAAPLLNFAALALLKEWGAVVPPMAELD